MKYPYIFSFLLLITIAGCSSANNINSNTNNLDHSSDSLYSIPVHRSCGTEDTLSDFKGKVLLITNIATKCGTTPQLKELEELHNKYKSQGFTVLGFPSNDFSPEEPEDSQEIHNFCKQQYNVSFPIYQIGNIRGKKSQALFQHITQECKHEMKGDVNFNFEKFLIDRNGDIRFRYGSFTGPLSGRITRDVEALIAEVKVMPAEREG